MISRLLNWNRRRLAQQARESEIRRREFERRLRSPDFELIQRHFGKPISVNLAQLYSNVKEILRHDIEKVVSGAQEDENIYVAWYEPLDELSLQYRWPSHPKLFQFADDGSGSKYAVDPTDEEGGIFYLEHESGDIRPSGVKISEFLGLEERG